MTSDPVPNVRFNAAKTIKAGQLSCGPNLSCSGVKILAGAFRKPTCIEDPIWVLMRGHVRKDPMERAQHDPWFQYICGVQ